VAFRYVVIYATLECLGLSVLEAVALGCVPVLPNRQVYPELFGDEYLYLSDIKNRQVEAKAAVDLIQRLIVNAQKTPLVSQYSAKELLPHYDALIKEMAG
jgi:glycosyltransferase involved in cell wall biosynthesis